MSNRMKDKLFRRGLADVSKGAAIGVAVYFVFYVLLGTLASMFALINAIGGVV